MARRSDLDLRRINQLATQRTSRRRFLRRGAVAVGAVAVGPTILSACGDDDDGGEATSTSGASGSAALEGTTLSIFNWPLYIENDDPQTSPTLSAFTEQTGVEVDYQPNIDSNEDFFTGDEGPVQPVSGVGGASGADCGDGACEIRNGRKSEDNTILLQRLNQALKVDPPLEDTPDLWVRFTQDGENSIYKELVGKRFYFGTKLGQGKTGEKASDYFYNILNVQKREEAKMSAVQSKMEAIMAKKKAAASAPAFNPNG